MSRTKRSMTDTSRWKSVYRLDELSLTYANPKPCFCMHQPVTRMTQVVRKRLNRPLTFSEKVCRRGACVGAASAVLWSACCVGGVSCCFASMLRLCMGTWMIPITKKLSGARATCCCAQARGGMGVCSCETNVCCCTTTHVCFPQIVWPCRMLLHRWQSCNLFPLVCQRPWFHPPSTAIT